MNFVGSRSGDFQCLVRRRALGRATGELRRAVSAGRGAASGVAERDGFVYAGALAEELLCLDLERGAIAWFWPADSGDVVYVGSIDGSLRAYRVPVE